MRTDLPAGQNRSTGLVDVLDRVLDKGLVIAGDIKVSLAEVELLTIRIRLIVCSLDKAQEIGLDWWRHDRYLSPGRNTVAMENEELREQIRRLEAQVAALTMPGASSRAELRADLPAQRRALPRAAPRASRPPRKR